MPHRVPKSRLLPPRTAREAERLRLLKRLRLGFARSPVLVRHLVAVYQPRLENGLNKVVGALERVS